MRLSVAISTSYIVTERFLIMYHKGRVTISAVLVAAALGHYFGDMVILTQAVIAWNGFCYLRLRAE